MAAPLGNKYAVGNQGGRPTKYNPEYNEQVYKLTLLGATDKEIADFFNVTEQTVLNWYQKEQEFLEAKKKGKIEADSKVVQSTYKRAIGYEYTEEHITLVDDGTKNPKIKEKKIIKKQMAPDVMAQIWWSKNRRPDQWRDKKDVELIGNSTKIEVQDEETKTLLEEVKKALNDIDENNEGIQGES